MVRIFFNKRFLQVLLLGLLIGALTSCNSLKRVPEDEFLLVKNTIYVDSVATKDRRQNNLLEQKSNAKVLGIPLGVYIYNLAKQHPDSVFDKNIQQNQQRYQRYKNIFSAKQVERMGRSYTRFNEWLKRTGSAPEIVNPSEIERSKTQIKAWYWNQGWFNASVEHQQDTVKPQKAEVIYYVASGQQYKLDSIHPKIETPKLLELYKSNLKDSHLKRQNAYRTIDFNNEQNRLTQLYRNKGFYYFE
ncbi:MAG: POTRA domain-containing protein, partial [Flavobacteriaceae bacterium]|nr:POTRA domain-containing protein [Flavobacteriaceae bacterium]